MAATPRRAGEVRSSVATRLTGAALGLLMWAGAAACGDAGPREPYRNTFPTREAVARAVVDALAARDAERLAALAVSHVEFRKNIWPRLPASRPAIGMPLAYVWEDTSVRSRASLAGILREFGGRRLRVEAVSFAGEAADYGAFRLHPKTRLTVTDDAGRRSTIRVMGSLLEAAGGWKVFSFVVD
jgi:hypothetical protein